MEEDLDPEIIKATQISLGKYIKRPPLTDKLLKKPPFRFLHDIVTNIIKNTGFFDGLFEEEELKSENVKDRESKILFLNKVISVVGTTTGKTLLVKPSKIVSGQEAEKTNELLQCLAYALDKKLSSDEAVKQHKSSKPGNKAKETKVVKKNQQPKKLTSSQSTEKLIKNDKNDTVSKTKQKEITIKKDSAQKKNSQSSNIQSSKVLSKIGLNKSKQASNKQSKTPVTKNNSHNDVVDPPNKQDPINTEDTLDEPELIQENKNIEIPNLESPNISKTENEIISSNNSVHNDSSNDVDGLKDEILNKKDQENIMESKLVPFENDKHDIRIGDDAVISDIVAVKKDESSNKSDIGNVQRNVEKVKPEPIRSVTNKRPPSVRPLSSRPSAPRLRDKHETIINSNENNIVGKVNIISESTVEEDEDSIVIVDNTQANTDYQDQDNDEQHGHLVQQILDAQKEFSQTSGKTEIEWQFGVQKSRDMVHEEIEQLRFNIQALSRVANPLGKLLDHIQEDVEVMRQELQQWTNTYEDASKELVKQRSLNEESLYPLHTKIKQLNLDIAEKHDKINDLKIIIHKNGFRIEKLLFSGQRQYL